MVSRNVAIVFGRNVARARRRVGITQADLGQAIGVSSQAVSQWERGETMPEVEKIPAIARQLAVSVDWLFTGDESYDWPREVWMRIGPEQRKQAIRVLKALAGEDTEAA